MANGVIYGKGIRFPLILSRRFDWVSGDDAVAQAIRSILLTDPGERINPEYGAGLRRFLFAQNNLSTRALVRQTVSDALQRDEHRIELIDVDVTADESIDTLMRISIVYRLLDSPTPQNLVFPFYLDKGIL
ncbi:hypothetical protein D3OALGA1CA_4389 [Olavius algarvensis associated proteobacterium Delta 3]|nr:hypothetical protein D3OALGA1CA_4389 [Olavius algarvensis associated proteobacterium Delta 3]CAB5162268.1 hypothetical protein D3OALGB2SA_5499 [Olavius algarvensis associated proteobacterium Delta 3]